MWHGICVHWEPPSNAVTFSLIRGQCVCVQLCENSERVRPIVLIRGKRERGLAQRFPTKKHFILSR